MTVLGTFGSTKRSLLALSHAMERSIQVAATPGDGPRYSLLISMFQRREYFEPERERYTRIAERGTHAALLAAGGWYAQTWRYQQLAATVEQRA